MSEKKWREYYVNDNAEGDGGFTVSRTPWFGFKHVIETGALKELQAENEKLRREVEVLRQFGNKDCTTMADEYMNPWSKRALKDGGEG